MNQEEQQSRRRLLTFIIINVVEEVIIASIAFIILSVFAPWFLLPGMIIVAVGLVLFTLVKIYSYWSSTRIPVDDPLIGQEGVALEEFRALKSKSWVGKIRVRGEVWKAQAQQPIYENTRVWVQGIEGLTLQVTLSENEE
jgi:membrane-bound ClpP family serine protease